MLMLLVSVLCLPKCISLPFTALVLKQFEYVMKKKVIQDLVTANLVPLGISGL